MAESEKRGARGSVRVFASAAEADRHDAEYWLSLPPNERVAAVWRLSLEQYRLAGLCNDEPRFDRTAVRIRYR